MHGPLREKTCRWGVRDLVRFIPFCQPTETSLTIKSLHIACTAIILSTKLTTMALNRLRGCAVWSVPFMFACKKKSVFSLDDSQLLSVDHLSRLTVVFIISPHELTTIKEIVGVEFLNFDIFDAEPLCNIQHQCLVCIRNF